jgi:hypothetical protein
LNATEYGITIHSMLTFLQVRDFNSTQTRRASGENEPPLSSLILAYRSLNKLKYSVT